MKVTQVSYKKVLPTGSYSTEHIGLEATVDEGESAEDVLRELKRRVHEFHIETNQLPPTSDNGNGNVYGLMAEGSEAANSPKTTEEEIDACTTVQKLKEFRLLCYSASSPNSLREKYESKLRELKSVQ